MTALLIATGVALASLGIALLVGRAIHVSHTPNSLGAVPLPAADEGTGAHPGEVGHSVSPRAVGSPRDASRPAVRNRGQYEITVRDDNPFRIAEIRQAGLRPDRREILTRLLREHALPSCEPDYPADEYECCADAILESGALTVFAWPDDGWVDGCCWNFAPEIVAEVSADVYALLVAAAGRAEERGAAQASDTACLYRQEGRACRLLPDLERELWCPACVAADALNLGGEQR